MKRAPDKPSPGMQLNRRCFLGMVAAGLAWSGSGLGTNLVFAGSGPANTVATKARRRFLHEQRPLVMTEDALRDANGKFAPTQLPVRRPGVRCN